MEMTQEHLLTIGVVGGTNVGKSTLVNAIIGQRLLPSASKSSTSVLTIVVPMKSAEAIPVLQAGDDVMEGSEEVRRQIKVLNEHVRSSQDASVHAISLRCGVRTSLQPLLEGGVRILDLPGCDEIDNAAVSQCLQVTLSICHAMIVLVKYDAITSEATADMFARIVKGAEHLFAVDSSVDGNAKHGASSPCPVTLVISQADLVSQNGMDDSDEEVGSVEDLTRTLRASLCKMSCFQGALESFPSRVPIIATSISLPVIIGNCPGGHDFASLEKWVLACHGSIATLQLRRKVCITKLIFATFQELLDEASTTFPQRANLLFEAEEEGCKWKDRKKLAVYTLIGAAATAGFCAGGGLLWCAGAAYATAAASMAAGATATAVGAGGAAALYGSGAFIVLWGTTVATSVGVVNAMEADRQVVFNADADSIRRGTRYQDTLTTLDGCGALYIGEFVEKVPDGDGRLFWAGTGQPAFVGDFKDGRCVGWTHGRGRRCYRGERISARAHA